MYAYGQCTTILLATMDNCNIQGHFTTYLYWSLYDIFNRSICSFVEYGSHLIHKIEFYQSKMHEDIFKILKDYEAFCIGYIIKQPGDIGFEELFNEVVASFKELCKKHDVDFNGLSKDLLLLNLSFSKEHVHFIIELTGIVKLFGYPLLNVERVLEAIRLNACKPVNIDSKFVYELTGMFKKLFCLAYFNRHHKWPLFKTVSSETIKKYYLSCK